jgi:hypothetical protein
MITLFQEEIAWEDQICQSLSKGKDPLKTSDSPILVSTTPPVSHDGCVWGVSTLTFWELCLDVHQAICVWKLITLNKLTPS